MRAQGKKHQAGFTLIEAMLASMILILSLCSVLALGARGFQYIADMRRWARSSQVLQQRMEDVRLVTVWTNVWALNNTTFTDTSISGMVYSGKIVISSYDPPYPTDYAACVSISISWTNTANKVLTNTMTSLLCKNGLNKYIF
jgi:Tfp pilus assembly protein PilV